MRRRLLTALGAASLLAVALPTSAQAAPNPAAGCTAQLKSAGSAQDAPAQTPYVVYQYSEDDGAYDIVWVTGVSHRGTTNLTSCTFHDRDRDGHYNVKDEPVFTTGIDFRGDGDGGGGGWPYGVVLDGVAEGEQVCSRATMRHTPIEGGKSTTTTTRLTCFPVEFFFAND